MNSITDLLDLEDANISSKRQILRLPLNLTPLL